MEQLDLCRERRCPLSTVFKRPFQLSALHLWYAEESVHILLQVSLATVVIVFAIDNSLHNFTVFFPLLVLLMVLGSFHTMQISVLRCLPRTSLEPTSYVSVFSPRICFIYLFRSNNEQSNILQRLHSCRVNLCRCVCDD